MAIGGIGSFWRLLREVSPGEIARQAEQSFCVLICGQPDVGKSTLRGALNGGRWPSDLALPYMRVVEGVPSETFGASLCLYVLDASRGPFGDDWRATAYLEARGIPLVYVFNKMDLVRDDDSFQQEARRIFDIISSAVTFVEATDAEVVRQNLVPTMLQAAPDLRLALGRRLPVFRDEAAAQVIRETALVNAEFALLSSLPASIPVVSVGSAASDMLVLTKNQAMMLVKLAAIYGRSLDSKVQLLVEVAPVVGAAFLWRTAARTAVALLPSFAAAAPKTLVAFVGTYLVGRAAQHYYRLGRRPSREALEHYAREAVVLARRSLPRLVPRRPRPVFHHLLPPRPWRRVDGHRGSSSSQ